MKAVIMAGGRGTRLSSVLRDLPKPMAPLAGKPLLEYQIENLKENEITEIILVTGHLGNVISDYFQDGRRFGVKITYYVEQEPLGTAGALAYLKKELKQDFILLFGDVYIDINFNKLVSYHEKKRAAATLYVHPNSHPYDSDLVVTDAENRIIGWNYKDGERTDDFKNMVNAGVYVLSPGILETIPLGVKSDLEKQVIASGLKKYPVYAYCCSEYVKDIGTPDRLKSVERDFLNGICRQKNLKNAQKCIFLDRDGTINRYVGFLTNHEQMELLDHAAEALRMINESEYLAIVVSNQPVVARGECSYEELERIHNRMHTLLGKAGAYVDGLYFCPHHPDRGFEGEIKELKIKCHCRKPDIGMFVQAAEDFNIDLSCSWMIGDMTADIQAGINAGLRTMLVRTGVGGGDRKYFAQPDFIKADLLQCVRTILDKKREGEDGS